MRGIWLFLCCCGWAQAAVQAKPVPLPLYSYHAVPPFTVNAQAQTGLNYDLLQGLQHMLGDGYQLSLQYVPRPVLNARLASGQPTIVLWANPAWFSQYGPGLLWSPVLFTDREVFVSHYQDGRKINQLTDLAGQRVGTLKGYRYPGLDALFENGTASRVEADSDQENLAALLEQRVDQLVITRSSLLFFGRQPQFLGKLTITGQPYPAYSRQILLTPHYQPHVAVISAAIEQLSQQSSWQQRLDLYGLKSR